MLLTVKACQRYRLGAMHPNKAKPFPAANVPAVAKLGHRRRGKRGTRSEERRNARRAPETKQKCRRRRSRSVVGVSHPTHRKSEGKNLGVENAWTWNYAKGGGRFLGKSDGGSGWRERPGRPHENRSRGSTFNCSSIRRRPDSHTCFFIFSSCLLGDVAFFRVFLYHCRFLFVQLASFIMTRLICTGTLTRSRSLMSPCCKAVMGVSRKQTVNLFFYCLLTEAVRTLNKREYRRFLKS